MELPKIEKVNAEVLKRHCEAMGVEFDEKNLKASVEGVSKAMAERAEKNEDLELCECPECKGDSTEDLDECPFCGVKDEPGQNETQQPQPEAATDEPQVSQEVQDMAAKKKASTKSTSKKATTKKASTKSTSKKATTKKAAATKAANKARKLQPKKATAKKTPSKKAPSKPTPAKTPQVVATTIAADADAIMSKDLAKSVKNVQTLQKAGMECTWELGKELANIYDNKLYLQMTGDKGKAVFKDWGTFASKVFGISAGHSYKLMDVALNFSKRQLTDIGVSKLSMIVRVPPQDRDRLLEQARTEPASKLSKEVAKLAAGRRRETGRDGFKGTPGQGRAATAAKKSDKLTIVRAKAKLTVNLFKKGTTERAQTPDDAVGEEKCANSVTVTYSLQQTAQGLAIVVEHKREE